MSKDTDVVLADAPASAEGVQVSLHPLPLLNISEHYTRVRIQNNGDLSKTKVFGALIGIQAGRELEIVNSFELAATFNSETNEWSINHDFLGARQNQFKQVFPAFEFLGWYGIGDTPSQGDLALHTQLLTYNESPIFLQLHPAAIKASSSNATAVSQLPLDIYESVVDIAGGKSEAKFVRISSEAGGYRVETYEAERVALESASQVTVANATSGNAAGQGGKGGQESPESAIVTGLSSQRNAISMLHSRIGGILGYLALVQQGKVTPDHETLRQISSLVASVTSGSSQPAKSSDDTQVLEGRKTGLDVEFEQEQNDVNLTSLLGMLTRNLEEANVLVDKFSITQAKEHRDDDALGGRRGGGGASRRQGDGMRRMQRREDGFGSQLGF